MFVRHSARVIRSARAGAGKSFQCQKIASTLKDLDEHRKYVKLCVHKTVDTDSIVHRLNEELIEDEQGSTSYTIQFDIANEVNCFLLIIYHMYFH